MLSSRELYERVDKLRREKGMSVNELSSAAGISHSTLNSWKLRGTMPKLDVLDGICYALGIHLMTLLYDMDIENISADEVELLELWKPLDKTQKEAVLTMMKAMNAKTE